MLEIESKIFENVEEKEKSFLLLDVISIKKNNINLKSSKCKLWVSTKEVLKIINIKKFINFVYI